MDNIIISRLYIFVLTLILVSAQRHFFQESNKVRNFIYRNCNTSAVPLYVNYLDVSPDPIEMGSFMFVNFSLNLDTDAGCHNKRIEVDVSLRLETKKDNISLCPILGESLCHYNDFCAILGGKNCKKYIPKYFNNNCSCPVETGIYATKKPIPIPISELSFEVRGTFDLTVIIHEEGNLLGCVEIHFCVTNCKPLGY